MTTNQTIDGVPREMLESVLEIAADQWTRTDELRALLDAPAPTPVPVAWMRFDDDQKAIFTRSRRANKSEPLYAHPTAYRHTAPAAKPRGEPVAMNRGQFEAWVLGREHPTYGWLDKHWLARGDNPETYADPYVQGLWVASQALYAEQPAPVGAARMCDCNQGRLPCSCRP